MKNLPTGRQAKAVYKKNKIINMNRKQILYNDWRADDEEEDEK